MKMERAGTAGTVTVTLQPTPLSQWRRRVLWRETVAQVEKVQLTKGHW